MRIVAYLLAIIARITNPYRGNLRRLMLILHGPMGFQILRTAIELEVFDILKKTPGQTARQLFNSLDVASEESLKVILDGCCALQIMRCTRGRYHSTIEKGSFFSLEQIKIFVNFIHLTNYRQQFYLFQSVKEDKPKGLQAVYGEKYSNLYHAIEHEPDLFCAWSEFMNDMHQTSKKQLYRRLDYSRYRRVLDLGGHDGTGAIELAKRYPNLFVTTFDLPFKRELALENFKRANLQQKCTFHGGSFFEDIPPGYDLVQLIHVYEMFSLENLRTIFSKVYDSLPNEGTVASFGIHLPDNVLNWPELYLGTVYFNAAATGQGGIRTSSELVKLLSEIGYVNVKQIPSCGGNDPFSGFHCLITGSKTT